MQRTVFAGIAAMAAMTSVAAVRFENDLQEQQYVEVDTGIDTGIDTEIGTEVDAEVDNELDTEIDIEDDKKPVISDKCARMWKYDGVNIPTFFKGECRDEFERLARWKAK